MATIASNPWLPQAASSQQTSAAPNPWLPAAAGPASNPWLPQGGEMGSPQPERGLLGTLIHETARDVEGFAKTALYTLYTGAEALGLDAPATIDDLTNRDLVGAAMIASMGVGGVGLKVLRGSTTHFAKSASWVRNAVTAAEAEAAAGAFFGAVKPLENAEGRLEAILTNTALFGGLGGGFSMIGSGVKATVGARLAELKGLSRVQGLANAARQTQTKTFLQEFAGTKLRNPATGTFKTIRRKASGEVEMRFQGPDGTEMVEPFPDFNTALTNAFDTGFVEKHGMPRSANLTKVDDLDPAIVQQITGGEGVISGKKITEVLDDIDLSQYQAARMLAKKGYEARQLETWLGAEVLTENMDKLGVPTLSPAVRANIQQALPKDVAKRIAKMDDTDFLRESIAHGVVDIQNLADASNARDYLKELYVNGLEAAVGDGPMLYAAKAPYDVTFMSKIMTPGTIGKLHPEFRPLYELADLSAQTQTVGTTAAMETLERFRTSYSTAELNRIVAVLDDVQDASSVVEARRIAREAISSTGDPRLIELMDGITDTLDMYRLRAVAKGRLGVLDGAPESTAEVRQIIAQALDGDPPNAEFAEQIALEIAAQKGPAYVSAVEAMLDEAGRAGYFPIVNLGGYRLEVDGVFSGRFNTFNEALKAAGELPQGDTEKVIGAAVKTGPEPDDYVVGFNHGIAAEEAAEEFAKKGIEPPIPKGHVRLYRGQNKHSKRKSTGDAGTYFTEYKPQAEEFARLARNKGRDAGVFYIDVPADQAASFKRGTTTIYDVKDKKLANQARSLEPSFEDGYVTSTGRFITRAEADSLKRQATRAFITPESAAIDAGSIRTVSGKDFGKMVRAIREAEGFEITAAEAAELLKGGGTLPSAGPRKYSRFLQQRKLGVRDFSEDPWTALRFYMLNMERTLAFDAFERQAGKIIENMPAQKSMLKEYAENYVDLMLGRPTNQEKLFQKAVQRIFPNNVDPRAAQRYSLALRRFQSWSKLGGVWSGVVNATQLAVNTAPLLGVKWTGVGIKATFHPGERKNIIKFFAENGVDLGIHTPLTKEGEIAGAEGVWSEIVAAGKLRKLGENKEALRRYRDAFENMWMFSFNGAERMNRLATAWGAYQKATVEHGMSKEAALAYAKEMTTKTQFNYRISNIPEIMQSPVGGLLGQFKTFFVNEIELIASLDRKSQLKMMMAMQAVGGLSGLLALPGVDLVDAASRYAFDTKVSEALTIHSGQAFRDKETAGGLTNFMAFGAPGLVGLDLSNYVGPGGLADFMAGWAGPALSDAGAVRQFLGEAARDFTVAGKVTGDTYNALFQRAAPAQIRRIFRGLDIINSGEVRNPYSGKLVYRPERRLRAGLLTAIGPQGIRGSFERTTDEFINRKAAEYREVRESFRKSIGLALVSGNRAEAEQLRAQARSAGVIFDENEMRRAAESLQRDASERRQRRTPVDLRADLVDFF